MPSITCLQQSSIDTRAKLMLPSQISASFTPQAFCIMRLWWSLISICLCCYKFAMFISQARPDTICLCFVTIVASTLHLISPALILVHRAMCWFWSATVPRAVAVCSLFILCSRFSPHFFNLLATEEYICQSFSKDPSQQPQIICMHIIVIMLF
jgi:hypothetical protein